MGKWVEGTVKNFKKSFGFVNVEGLEKDVFVALEYVRKSKVSPKQLVPGRRVKIKIRTASDGRPQASHIRVASPA
jgi:cold shock CspA family protein